MRHLTRKSIQDESASNNSAAEKSSAKKLKQARLPFKIITPSTSPVSSKSAATDKDKDTSRELRSSQIKEQQVTDVRKRKLSCDDDNECPKVINGDDNVSKENVEILAAATKKKKISTISNNDTLPEVVSLLEDDDDDIVEMNEDVPNTSAANATSKQERESVLKTPKGTVKDKRKGAGTPQTPQTRSNVQKDKPGSASKLQIKLPLSAGKKNKRRKSKLLQLAHNSSGTEGGSHNNSAQEVSGDDIEENDLEQNPLKRKKLNDKDCEKKEEEIDCKALVSIKFSIYFR